MLYRSCWDFFYLFEERACGDRHGELGACKSAPVILARAVRGLRALGERQLSGAPALASKRERLSFVKDVLPRSAGSRLFATSAVIRDMGQTT